jgi:hypothetical protein
MNNLQLPLAVGLLSLTVAIFARAELTKDGIYSQAFDNGHCFDHESNDSYEVEWCSENKNYDSNNGHPKGSARVDVNRTGTRLWYHFKGEPATSIHVEFEYSICKAVGNAHPSTGHAQYKTSADNRMNCPSTGWKNAVDLEQTWDPNVDSGEIYKPESFDVNIPAGDKGVYIQFVKPPPSMGTGVVLKIDNLKITPVQAAAAPPTRPAGSK